MILLGIIGLTVQYINPALYSPSTNWPLKIRLLAPYSQLWVEMIFYVLLLYKETRLDISAFSTVYKLIAILFSLLWLLCLICCEFYWYCTG